MNTSPTTEERIWAVIAHLSALAFGMGLLLPIIGWSEQRTKSKYASFQCLQALGYQSLGYTVWLLTYLLGMVFFVILMTIAVFLAGENGEVNPTLSMAWSGIFVFFIFGLLAVYFLLPIVAAVACGLGRDFRYPILGSRLARYLGYEPVQDDGSTHLIEEHEERWVASMGHFSVIIAFWGIIAPITTWILMGKRSAFLKFQSIQTTIYQAFVNLLYVGAMAVYVMGMVLFFVGIGLEGGNINTTGGTFAIFLFLFSLLLAALIMLILPLFHILGQWAGYRVLKGDHYRYPLLGKLVEKRLAKTSGVQEHAPEANGETSDSQAEAS